MVLKAFTSVDALILINTRVVRVEAYMLASEE
jgi:hypothetical protein